jgi:hypothetical protein
MPPTPKGEGVPIGENVFFYRDGDTLWLRMDAKHRGGKSASGKTIRVASTEGNKRAPEFPALKIGVNVYEQE